MPFNNVLDKQKIVLKTHLCRFVSLIKSKETSN